ncbi:hypothetical protein [Micromonospora auratinigra]|uniref:Ig-like domain-containing protein n=1 Tax=Micromonospora auratinigra TaxID=261654 RepID=A0A1A9A959_9ACTN|nr:hypothetical protein [Micromonospora auratinigra]SBT52648.1 hypothetical protein GA0070611_5725 [Micromonospora auratinigra]
MLRYPLVTLAVAALGLPLSTAPAQAAPEMPAVAGWSTPAPAPTGCTTSMEWIYDGVNYYYGRGKVQCTTGRYRVKIQCRNQQTGVGYVIYGGTAVNAPGTATATCYVGNVAEKVYPVEDPLPTGVTTGCAPWIEWVHEGSNHYYGRGRVQCDTGRYQVKINCRNLQTGVAYVVYGGQVVTAPDTATTTCYSGNVAESVEALPQ